MGGSTQQRGAKGKNIRLQYPKMSYVKNPENTIIASYEVVFCAESYSFQLFGPLKSLSVSLDDCNFVSGSFCDDGVFNGADSDQFYIFWNMLKYYRIVNAAL